VGRLKDAGLIAACGFMLNTTEFRDAACDVMRQVAGVWYGAAPRRKSGGARGAQGSLPCRQGASHGFALRAGSCRVPCFHLHQLFPADVYFPSPAPAARKQGDETPQVFRAVMEQVAEALIAAAAALLSPAAQASGWLAV
jgi:hypothetical protein